MFGLPTSIGCAVRQLASQADCVGGLDVEGRLDLSIGYATLFYRRAVLTVLLRMPRQLPGWAQGWLSPCYRVSEPVL